MKKESEGTWKWINPGRWVMGRAVDTEEENEKEMQYNWNNGLKGLKRKEDIAQAYLGSM
jgi:hypothetical protein